MPIKNYVDKISGIIRKFKGNINLKYPRNNIKGFAKEKKDEIQPIFEKIVCSIKSLLKIIGALIIIAINSFLLCYIINKIFAPHKEIDFPFNLNIWSVFINSNLISKTI